MSHSQFHSIDCLYLDMHGLIFETSVWLLAGSTRLLVHELRVCNNYFQQEIWGYVDEQKKIDLQSIKILKNISIFFKNIN